jgi:hypothetical protein
MHVGTSVILNIIPDDALRPRIRRGKSKGGLGRSGMYRRDYGGTGDSRDKRVGKD